MKKIEEANKKGNFIVVIDHPKGLKTIQLR